MAVDSVVHIKKIHLKSPLSSRRKGPCTSMARRAVGSNCHSRGGCSGKSWREIGPSILSGPALRFSDLRDSGRIIHTMELPGNSENVLPKSVLPL